MNDLNKFPTIKLYMEAMAEEKMRFHLVQISHIVSQYNDPNFQDHLIAKRKLNWAQTTHISLKR